MIENTLRKTILIPISIGLFSFGLSAKELTQKERNKLAAEMIPIYMLILSDEETKSLPIVVKKTGQTNSYDYEGNIVPNSNSRDDGHYQVGVDFNYTRNDETEIVTDHVTGRQWADDIGTKLALKPWLTDDNYDEQKYSDTSGDTAATFCKNLALGGFHDWRLPTRKELRSIVEFGHVTPTGNIADEDRNINPIFQNLTDNDHDLHDMYWTSTTYSRFKYDAWVVSFTHGDQYFRLKNKTAYIRCVRIPKKGE